MSIENTITVQVQTQYLFDQSSPKENRYAFAYTITISNLGIEAAKLISRHWLITDGNEQVQEVRGDGVVGEQPVIQPGESYHYTSGCLLETSAGTMEGSYQMISSSGHPFDAEIPCFTLIYPGALH
jgi:ApaG protein